MYSVSKNTLLMHLYNALCHSVQGNFLSSISFIQGHRYETELEGKTDDVADGETDMLCVRLLLGQAMRSTWRKPHHRGPIICLSPAGHCTSSGQQRPLDPHSRAFMTVCQPSICLFHPASFDWFKIMVAVCFTCLTDSSGSPTRLCQDFLILTALLAW